MAGAGTPDTHAALVAHLAKKLGRDAAAQLDMMAQAHQLVIDATSGRADAVADYKATLAQLTAAMGSQFVQRYERSLRKKLDAERAAQAAHFERGQRLYERLERDEPLSEQALDAFLDSSDPIAKELASVIRGKKPKI
jgi:hypothetical protein